MIDYSQTITVPENSTDTRLDIFLTSILHISRSQVKKLIVANEVLINGKLPKKSGDTLTPGTIITFQKKQQEPVFISVQGEVDQTLEPTIVHETTDCIVIDKPAGLLSHPTQANEPWSLAHWIWHNYPNIKGIGEYEDRPGIVHRLDKDTSGLMVIAKSQEMFDHLKKQFKERSVNKEYTTLVHGIIERDTDIIDFNIDRGSDGRMVARPNIDTMKLKNVGKSQPGKYAKTEIFVKQRYSRYTLLDVHIFTGRTHQIRVHMFAYNHPVVGDPLYTNTKINKKLDHELGRLFLHSHHLSFSDLQGSPISITIDLPKELESILQTLS